MPIFIGDYLADTAHLTTEQHGAYFLMLMTSWNRGGNLPNDDTQLAAICRSDKKTWSRIGKVVKAFFSEEGGYLIQARLVLEYNKALKLHDKQIENGRKGGRPAKTQTKPTGSGWANPNNNPNETPSPSQDTKSKAKPAQGKPAPFDPARLDVPDCVGSVKWMEWLDYRKSRRLQTTELSAKKQLEFLVQCAIKGQAPGEIIDASIRSGWQGLFELKEQSHGKNGSSRADRVSATIAELTGANRHPSPVIDGTATRLD